MMGQLLQAQPIIRSIDIRGNEKLSNRELLGAMLSKSSSYFSRAQLQQDLLKVLELYHQHGYYLARASLDKLVFAADSTSIDVELAMEEGELSRVGQVRIEGSSIFTSDEILQHFDTQPDKVFEPVVLEQDIENLLNRYEQRGHPFAKASIANISPREDSSVVQLFIRITIDEGPLVRINEIQVEGNKETKSNVIVRETRIRAGETYNHEKVRSMPQRLNRLNIFSSVSQPELFITPRGGLILIKVQEGPTNTFDGVAGYVPGIAGESGFFTGLVNVGMRNLFGTGRKLNVHWQHEDRYSQELALRYTEPWVFDLPINVNGSFFQRQQDTTYVRRILEFKADVLLTENLSLGALYNHESVIPSSTISALAVFNSSTITTGLEVHYDSRDDILSPTTGVLYSSDYRIGQKKIFGLPDTTSVKTKLTVQKIHLDVEWFVETFAHHVFALGLHGRELRSDDIEVSDLYRFGGTNTMRGYRENQFLGSRIVWSNTEYRFLLARRSFFFGFFDTGYYFRPDNVRGISSVQGVKYGYGIGIRLETALGNIGVSFALGEGDSFGQGKIHFGLMNEF